MRWRLSRLSLSLWVVACATTGPSPAAPAAETPGPDSTLVRELQGLDALRSETLATGRRYTEMFWAGQLEPLHARFSEQMKAALPTETWQAAHDQITQGLGAELETVSEGTQVIGARRTYWRVAKMKDNPGLFKTLWVVDAEGAIYTFLVTQADEAAPTPHLSYVPKTELTLPFEGRWYVAWGGPDIEHNYHAKSKDQRFALDILRVEGGRSYSGEGTELTDYYAFGQPVRAVAPGVVIDAGDGVQDNPIGEMNPKEAFGNYVVLDHGNGEFSMYAHFVKGSLQVAKGDKVTRGQTLGRCGNSGNSSEPHIHYHLQTTPTRFDGQGLPPVFTRARVNGVPKQAMQLKGGDFVTPAPQP